MASNNVFSFSGIWFILYRASMTMTYIHNYTYTSQLMKRYVQYVSKRFVGLSRTVGALDQYLLCPEAGRCHMPICPYVIVIELHKMRLFIYIPYLY
jgi:hypothetical protein